jgi:hypothetical protein
VVHLFASNVRVRFNFWLSASVGRDALDRHFEPRDEAILKLCFTFGSVQEVL